MYGDKSTIKVNEVKEHLLKKDKIVTQWRVSLIMMSPRKFIIQKKKVMMEVLRVTQNIRIWSLTIITRRGTSELIVDFERRKNQMLMSHNWLEKMKNSATFYLLRTDQLVIKMDYWLWMFTTH